MANRLFDNEHGPRARNEAVKEKRNLLGEPGAVLICGLRHSRGRDG